MELDAVCRPGIDTPFSAAVLNNLEMGERGSFGNPIPLDEEEDKENYPLTTPMLNVRLSLPGCAFAKLKEKVPESILGILFQLKIVRACVTFFYSWSKRFINITFFFRTTKTFLRKRQFKFLQHF